MDAEHLLNQVLKGEFNLTTSEDILVFNQATGLFTVGGTVLPEQQVIEIINAAKELDQNILFKYLIKELEFSGLAQANTSKNWDEMRFPKANLWVAKLLKDKVNLIKTLVPKSKVAKEPKPKK